MKRFMTKKAVVVVATTALTLGIAGSALAYFTSTGTGTSSGTVAGAQTNTWGVTFPGPNTYSAGSAIYAGTNEQIPVTITNTGNGNQGLLSVTVALKTNGSDVATSAGADISGCLSSWWSVTVTNTGTNFGKSMAPNATDSETVTLTLNDDATHNQNACESASPGFTVTAG
jgi:hypothetical protein